MFDFPNPSFTAEQRFTTNVPLQRLYFMNSSFVYKQAETFAKRVYDEGSDTARIQKAYRILFGRVPSEAEMKAGLDFLQAHPETPGRSDRRPADHGLEGVCARAVEFQRI